MLAHVLAACSLAVALVIHLFSAADTAAQDATPVSTYRCEDGLASGSPPADAVTPGPMMTGTPMAGMAHMMEFDQMYIDMMIPHHESIIAMSEAALPRLSDERLREIARAVIVTQRPEIEELRDYREQLYGDATPMPMDQAMIDGMSQMMPGLSGTMDEMAFQMDADAQVAAICAAENPDLAFIELTIPHHQMAIESSEIALDQATHPEIVDFAQRVIDTQQREIEMLEEIRAELPSDGTPDGS